VKKAGEKLIIIGPVADVEYFRQYVGRTDGVGVQYLGEVTFSVKVNYLARTRALFYPVQYEEFFSIVMVETLATGGLKAYLTSATALVSGASHGCLSKLSR